MGKISEKELAKYLDYTIEDALRDVNVTEKYVAFLGGVFSNFFPCEISIDEDWDTGRECHTFISSEQLFMWYKAMHFRDYDTAGRILRAKSPMDAKKLGRQVKGFDEKEWENCRYDYMFEAVLKKFEQNENLSKILLAEEFISKDFVEGNMNDNIYAVGLDWRNPEIADEKNWNGLNLLGEVLNDVRLYLGDSEVEELPW